MTNFEREHKTIAALTELACDLNASLLTIQELPWLARLGFLFFGKGLLERGGCVTSENAVSDVLEKNL